MDKFLAAWLIIPQYLRNLVKLIALFLFAVVAFKGLVYYGKLAEQEQAAMNETKISTETISVPEYDNSTTEGRIIPPREKSKPKKSSKNRRKRRTSKLLPDIKYEKFVEDAMTKSLDNYKRIYKGQVPQTMLDELNYNDYESLQYAFDIYATRFIRSMATAQIDWLVVDSIDTNGATREESEKHFYKILKLE